MNGSSVIFIVMLIVIPLVLFACIAPPYIADRCAGLKCSGQRAACGAGDGRGPARVRPPVVIVGAGFAGLNAAHALRKRAHADVTIVDGHDYHTFQPLLYQVSTGYLAPEEVGAALRAASAGQANVRVRIGKASGLDYPAHALVLQDGSRLDFDNLIVAAGADANFFGIPGMRTHVAALHAARRDQVAQAPAEHARAACPWLHRRRTRPVVPPLRAVPGRAGQSTTPSMSNLTVRTSPSSPDLITSRRWARLLNDTEQQEMLVCVDEELEQRRACDADLPGGGRGISGGGWCRCWSGGGTRSRAWCGVLRTPSGYGGLGLTPSWVMCSTATGCGGGGPAGA